MIESMTGFGGASSVFENKKIIVEIKSLNSKNCDLNVRLPGRYKSKELEIHKILKEDLKRGKVDFYLNLETVSGGGETLLNKAVLENYIKDLKTIAPQASDIDLLSIASHFPEVISSSNYEVSEEEWKVLVSTIKEALNSLAEFRKIEGKALQTKLASYVKNIEENLSKVIPFEEVRIQNIKEKLRANLKEFQEVDEARFYQEIIYYTEKLDISEEKVRLAQHCKYYMEVMRNEESNGKKLGFIAQEMGREINTLGSKASHQEIQKLVVKMKDDLEKIKEQTLNVL